MIPAPGARLVDTERGLVSRRVFADPEIHRLEQQRIFRRTWCFLAHESSIAAPGDFLATTIGEDPVIVWRDKAGRIRAFLNTCPHRGNKLCLFDQGHANTIQCIYHGWTFDSGGQLVGVPFEDRAYFGDLDRTANSLYEVPQLTSYGGLVFGCWDNDAEPLERHLGELRWWLDVFLCSDDLGGLRALPGRQRYRTAGNWKVFCDNFVGDRYHTNVTHASAVRLGMARKPDSRQGDHGYFMTFLAPAHGIGGFFTDTAQYEADLRRAEAIGPEVVEYVRARFAGLQARMAQVADRPTHFSFGLGFPNFLLQGVGRAFQGNLIGTCSPRGLAACEVSQWVLVERDAPLPVQQAAAQFATRGQSGAGLIGVDDGENFERIAEMLAAPSATGLTFDYSMGLQREGTWPGSGEWHVQGLPGMIGPEFWEVSQRRFYAHWAALMGLNGAA